jgi:hypothetical protein
MARMIPERFERHEFHDSRAEEVFYDRCQSVLSDDFVVLHSVQWDPGRRPYEIDFLVLHPSHGGLVVEAKSGEIREAGGSWYQNKRKLSKSPYEQVTENVEGLELHLLAQPLLKIRVPLRYCVFFPHTGRAEIAFDQAQLNRTMFREDVASDHFAPLVVKLIGEG